MASKWTQIITPRLSKISSSEAAAAMRPVTDEVDKGLKNGMNRAGKSMIKGGAVATAGLTAPIVAFLKTGAQGLSRIETIGAQTDAVLKSTSNAANVTRKEIDALAGSIEDKTGIEAESITEGQNLLLTFKEIKNGVGAGNDVFNQATKSLVDMSTAMGTDPRSAAIQLGKALNDPIKGIGALSRVGVGFTKDQEKMIKSLVAGGKTMEAQKIILGELDSQFGGSANNYGETMAGQAAKAGHAWGTLQEAMAENIMPALLTIVKSLSAGLAKFNALSPGTKKFITYFALALAVIGPVLVVVGSLVTAISAIAPVVALLGGAFALVISPVALIVIGIIALVAIIVIAYKRSETFRNAVHAVWEGIKKAITTAVNIVIAYFKLYLAAYVFVWNAIKTATLAAVNFIKNAFKAYIAAYVFVWNAIKTATLAAINFIKNIFNTYIAAYVFLWNGIKRLATGAINFLRTIGQKVKDVFSGAKDWLKEAGANIIKGLVSGIKSAANLPKEALKGALGGMRSLLPFSPAKEGPFSGKGWTKYSGQAMIKGLKTGIESEGPDVKRSMSNTMSAIKSATDMPVSASASANDKQYGNFTQIIQTPAPQSLGDIQRAARRGALLGGAI